MFLYKTPSLNSIMFKQQYIVNTDIPAYNEVNYDDKLRKQVSEYFYYKVDGWKQYDYEKLLKYITIVNEKPQLIKNTKELDNNNENNKLKLKYLENKFLTKKKKK